MTDEAPRYIDDLTVREVYAEGVQALFGSPGIVRVELGVNRWTRYAPIQVHHVQPVARFALGFESARNLRDQLTHLLDLADKQQDLAQRPAAGRQPS